MESAFRMASVALSGPTVSTVTSPPCRLLDHERLFDGVLVDLVDDVVGGGAGDGVVRRVHLALATGIRDLLDQNDDVHARPTSATGSWGAGRGPPGSDLGGYLHVRLPANEGPVSHVTLRGATAPFAANRRSVAACGARSRPCAATQSSRVVGVGVALAAVAQQGDDAAAAARGAASRRSARSAPHRLVPVEPPDPAAE